MRVIYQYVGDVERDGAPCPFCGGEVEMHPASGQYDLHHFYCTHCKVEFTIDERVADYEEGRIRNLYLDDALDRWNERTEAGPYECPFCGGEVHPWPWGMALFDVLYCPSCKKRFEFQSHPHSKNSMRRTLREFGRRPGSV